MALSGRTAGSGNSVEEGLKAAIRLLGSGDVGNRGYYEGLEPSGAYVHLYDVEARAKRSRG